jgi:DNA-binding IclR family transcriptional regulator
MAVNGSKSGTRILAVLELIARNQPVGVSEIARLMDADKSAIQRAIVTLAREGWIQAAPLPPTRWLLTGHIHLVAHLAHGGLRGRVRAALEALRDTSGETTGLTVPDAGRFVTIEAVESRQRLRMALHVGMEVLSDVSATGRAVLPYLPAARQLELLGAPPSAQLQRDFATSVRQGYFVREDDDVYHSINIAAPVFEVDGSPMGAVILCAPRERLTPSDYERVGAMVLRTARELSLSAPPAITLPEQPVRKVRARTKVTA